MDDVEVNRKLLIKLLEELRVEVQEASSGEEAIVLWQTWQPQLILMDFYMPGIGGCEAIRRIRAQETDGQRLVPIVAVTAKAITEGEVAIEAGCQAVISRPIRREELLICITNQLDWQMD